LNRLLRAGLVSHLTLPWESFLIVYDFGGQAVDITDMLFVAKYNYYLQPGLER
jgi:hypothetical protein